MSRYISTLAGNRFYLDSVQYDLAFLRHFYTGVVYQVYMTEQLHEVIQYADAVGSVERYDNIILITWPLVIKVNEPREINGILTTKVEIDELFAH